MAPQGQAKSPTVNSSFEQLLEAAPDAMVGVEESGRIVFVNSQTETLFDYDREGLLGETVEVLVPDRFRDSHPKNRASYFAEPRTRPMGADLDLYGRRRDGSEFPAEISLSSIETETGRLAIAAIRDVSERRAVERQIEQSEREKALHEQLAQARRLESVGQLAGGIAHDFNNILAVILNYAEFVGEELDADSQAGKDVVEIQRAAERAAALTRQLLIFSRREVVKPELLYLQDVISELENLLRRAIGEHIELETRLGPERHAVEADPGQIEQVLVNLAVNARDAMPDGGRLLIEVDEAELDDEYADVHPQTDPGSYVRLKVSDTGSGMDAETLQRAYEPFFTTKGKAEGTGLGLATVYGIVTGAGGRIDIYSEPGMGTTVKIHLPTSSKPATAEMPVSEERPAARGETILVVEDEPDIRVTAERILGKAGYTVLTCAGGDEALELCRQEEMRIDLLLTDVIMPGMLGTELVDRLEPIRPDVGIVFMSGYSHEVLAPDALAEKKDGAFIEKPFNAGELLRTVRGVLDRGDRAGG